MRQIKFRAWDSNEKFFHTPMTIEQMLEICCLPSDAIGLMAVKFKITRSSLIFQQFTGLLDKNGKEIWEDDIVKLHDHPTGIDDCTTSVVFMRGSFVAEYNGILLSDYGTAWTEVIGNIYENPDLLK